MIFRNQTMFRITKPVGIMLEELFRFLWRFYSIKLKNDENFLRPGHGILSNWGKSLIFVFDYKCATCTETRKLRKKYRQFRIVAHRWRGVYTFFSHYKQYTLSIVFTGYQS